MPWATFPHYSVLFACTAKRYWLGGALSIIFSVLLIGMNHAQITYYFLIIAACLLIVYIIKWIKNKEYKHLFISLAILAFAGIIGACVNLVPLATQYDFFKSNHAKWNGFRHFCKKLLKKLQPACQLIMHFNGAMAYRKHLLYLFPIFMGAALLPNWD